MAKPVSFNGEAPMGKDVKDTQMLTPGAKEKAANTSAENKLERHKSGKHPAFGKGGAKGHPD